MPELIRVTQQLDPSELRLPGGRIDVDRIASVAPALDRAESTLNATVRHVRGQTAHTWLGPVDDARATLLTKLTSLQRTLHSANLAATIAPRMLGQDGVKRYFVAFQNDAEARGTGGLPGTFAIVRADHGAVTFEHFAPDTELDTTDSGIDLGPDFDKLYAGGRATSYFVNSNLSPHFPDAARIWIAMWEKHAHEKIDGAVALDPTVLSYLLADTGPVTLPDGTSVTADNVVGLTQNELYLRFAKADEVDERKTLLVDLASAVSTRLFGGKSSVTGLVRAAAQASGEHRLLVYSTDPAAEAALTPTTLSGVVPRTSQPYAGLAIVNVAGTKLDYYLGRSLTWQRTGCGAVRRVTVTVGLTNIAPASGLPAYVTDRHDYPTVRPKPGDNRLAVYYFATQGAALRSVQLDGVNAPASTGVLRGHPAVVADVELPRGHLRTLTLVFDEPAGTQPVTVAQQPLVSPLNVDIEDARCDQPK